MSRVSSRSSSQRGLRFPSLAGDRSQLFLSPSMNPFHVRSMTRYGTIRDCSKIAQSPALGSLSTTDRPTDRWTDRWTDADVSDDTQEKLCLSSTAVRGLSVRASGRRDERVECVCCESFRSSSSNYERPKEFFFLFPSHPSRSPGPARASLANVPSA